MAAPMHANLNLRLLTDPKSDVILWPSKSRNTPKKPTNKPISLIFDNWSSARKKCAKINVIKGTRLIEIPAKLEEI